jgi:hypothetical protein
VARAVRATYRDHINAIPNFLDIVGFDTAEERRPLSQQIWSATSRM